MVSETVRARRAQKYAERRASIVDAARAVAEADGWDAVTTRRLADAIEHTQPVLYAHFPQGKPEIMNAVALLGFAEIAERLAPPRTLRSDASRLRHVVAAYLEFADANPRTYEAMFVRPIEERFADESSAPEMVAAFEVLHDVFARRSRPPADPGAYAEVLWSALHGLVTLERDRRFRPDDRPKRIASVVALFS